MASRGDGGPPRLGEVPDLSALRTEREEQGLPLSGDKDPGFYANDVQPTIQTEGSVTLEFRYSGPQGYSDPVRVTIPAGLYAALLMQSGPILQEAAMRHANQARRLADVVRAARAAAQEAEAEHHGGAPVDLSGRRPVPDEPQA